MAQFTGWHDNALAPEIRRNIIRRFDADHRGSPPVSGPKYVCTTFIHSRY